MKSLIFKIKWFLFFRFRFIFNPQKQKNIALVVNSFNKGGLEEVVLNLYYGYKQKGYNVYILSAFNDAPMAKKLYDIRDIYIFNNNPENFINFCKKKHINILHYHYNTLMMRAAKQMGFKVIYTMHNVYTWFNKVELIEYKSRLDSADYVVCVSDYVKNYYTTLTGAANAVAVPNGLDFSRLDKQFEDFNISKQSLGLQDKKVIVSVASFYPVKHQIGLIGAMEEVIKTRPDAHLLLVGNVGDKGYYETFIQTLKNSPAKDNITHLKYIDNKYMGEFLKEVADIFVLASLQEGFGNATLEALYCQKPAVITDTGCAENIKNIDSCVVVPPAYNSITEITNTQIEKLSLQKDNINTHEIAKALCDVINNFDDYQEKAKNNPQKLVDFSLESMINQYAKLIEN